MARLLVSFLVLVAPVCGQDTTACEAYDLNTGRGTCNGVAIDIAGVICAGCFDKDKCKASKATGDGRTETYYFKVGGSRGECCFNRLAGRRRVALRRCALGGGARPRPPGPT